MNSDEIYKLETSLWEAAKRRDKAAFLRLTDDSTVMVCGGYRCTGSEYAGIIADFDCRAYTIENFEVVCSDTESVQVHYVLIMEVKNPRNSDLAGKFHVTTTWHRKDGRWKIAFNMDQRMMREDTE
ncbi:MAG: nuclear transport factor 2 family protein [Ruminiclostridium sp.]|nr:nuclear transport factor 2 family protein [Ruminiclostridium sp.]